MDRSFAHPSADRERPAAAGLRGAGAVPAPHVQRLLTLQRAAGNAAVAGLLEDSQGKVQADPDVWARPDAGTAMEPALRSKMEGALGADFSDVRLHRGPAASQAVAALGARAYTMGNDVVLGEGSEDEFTLAHELTHVVQQRAGPVDGTDPGSGLRISDPGDAFERAAAATAADVIGGRASQAGSANLAGPGAAASPTVVQRAVVYDASGTPTEYADSEILFDASTGRWETPRGDLLKRNADGSYSPADKTSSATPQATASSPAATTSSQATAVPKPTVIDPKSYADGYNAGRAGNERNPGPLDPADADVYDQGYADGVKEAERTKASAGPAESGRADLTDRPSAESSGSEPLPDFLAWTPSRSAMVHDASGAATEYPEDEIRFESPTGLYIGPKGQQLVRNADGSYSPAPPETGSAEPKATVSAPKETPEATHEGVDEQGRPYVGSPAGREYATQPGSGGSSESPGESGEETTTEEKAKELAIDKLKELALEKGIGAARLATWLVEFTRLADLGELGDALEAAQKFVGGGLFEAAVGEEAAGWVALGTGLSPMAVWLFLAKAMGVGSVPDEAIGPCPSHSCPVDSAAAGMSGGDFPCVLKWGHRDEHHCTNGHVWADKWNTAWAHGFPTPEAAGL